MRGARVSGAMRCVQGCLLVVWAAWRAASFHCCRPTALDPHLTEEGCTYVPILGTFVGRVQQAIGVRDTSDWYAVIRDVNAAIRLS